MDRSDSDSFKNAKDKSYIQDVYYSSTTGRNTISISAPIKSDKNEKFLGVISARTQADLLDHITLDKTGLGETGQVYIVNKDYLAITSLMFLDNEETFLKKKIDTKNSRGCFLHKTLSEDEIKERHKEVEVFK